MAMLVVMVTVEFVVPLKSGMGASSGPTQHIATMMMLPSLFSCFQSQSLPIVPEMHKAIHKENLYDGSETDDATDAISTTDTVNETTNKKESKLRQFIARLKRGSRKASPLVTDSSPTSGEPLVWTALTLLGRVNLQKAKLDECFANNELQCQKHAKRGYKFMPPWPTSYTVVLEEYERLLDELWKEGFYTMNADGFWEHEIARYKQYFPLDPEPVPVEECGVLPLVEMAPKGISGDPRGDPPDELTKVDSEYYDLESFFEEMTIEYLFLEPFYEEMAVEYLFLEVLFTPPRRVISDC